MRKKDVRGATRLAKGCEYRFPFCLPLTNPCGLATGYCVCHAGACQATNRSLVALSLLQLSCEERWQGLACNQEILE